MVEFYQTYQDIILFVVVIVVFLIGYVAYSYVGFNKQRKSILKLQNSLNVNDEVILSSGFYAIIVELNDNIATVKLADNVIVKINRYSISAKK